jgi:L-aminopeptidase/D-esterase-like protein
MLDAITDVPGIEVGQAQDLEGGTGCTVVLARKGATGAVDVRGGAPATRETPVLAPENLVDKVHAIYLGGGSAFGLAGATGVMDELEALGIGYDVGVTVVPIVCGACVIDLTVGDFRARPTAAMGRDACRAARSGPVAQGNVGAGTGAAIGSGALPGLRMKGGIGTASCRTGDLVVGAIVVVNPLGDVRDPMTGELLCGMLDGAGGEVVGMMKLLQSLRPGSRAFDSNTTAGVVATNARLTKPQGQRVAIMAHDGYARAINPIHTLWDGDTVFTLATGEVDAEVNLVGALAAEVMARAVVNGVIHAESRYGLPCCREVREWRKRR